jgi:hypothetical protein
MVWTYAYRSSLRSSSHLSRARRLRYCDSNVRLIPNGNSTSIKFKQVATASTDVLCFENLCSYPCAPLWRIDVAVAENSTGVETDTPQLPGAWIFVPALAIDRQPVRSGTRIGSVWR